MIRGAEDPDEVVCFGFFDGTIDELRGAGQDGYSEQMAAIAPYVESEGTNALFEVVEDYSRTRERAPELSAASAPLPGLNSPRGSSAALIARIIATAASPCSSTRKRDLP